MSNSRRGRRAVRRRREQARNVIADAAARYPQMVAEAVATMDRVDEQASNTPWSNFSQSDYTPAQWRRACLIDTGQGDPDSKDRYSLPVREPSGALNRNGVHAAAGRIHGTDAPAEVKQRAARALVRLYRSELDEEPPPRLLTLAGQSREAVEELGVVEAPRGDRPGRMSIQLIKAGWSLNGRYYPAEVLRRDGPEAFPAGTQAFVDHATEEEAAERPSGSVRDLAAVMATPARWDEQRQALVAEVRLFQPWREALTDMAENIGMSIRAMVLGDYGEADGREGLIVSQLVEGRSVDFVTKAAAGGSILSVLESAQAQHADEARNVGGWLESRLHLALTQLGDEMYGDGRLSRDERMALSGALGDALATFASRVEGDAPQLYQRDLYDGPEAVERPAAEATVEPLPAAEITTELRQLDQILGAPKDVPALLAPASTADGTPPTATNEREGTPMSETQDGARAPDEAGTTIQAPPASTTTTTIESPEAQIAAYDRERQYRSRAANVEASEAQVAVIAQERDQFRARANSLAEALTESQNEQRRLAAERDRAVSEARQLRANETGRLTVDKMLGQPEQGVPENLLGLVAPRVHSAVHGHVPLTEHGEVDMAALEALVGSAIRQERVHAAQLMEAQGVGRVQGLGAEGDPTMQMTTKQFEEQVSGLFADIGLDDDAVNLATKGR